MKIQECAAVVTGGTSGIGKAICQALAEANAKVCFVGRNASAGETFANELKLSHGEEHILYVQADVSKQEELQNAFDRAKDLFGHIDVVVNNAGCINEKEWRTCVEVNLIGVISGTMLAIDHMQKDRGGRGGVIINMASKAGLVAPLCHFIPTYATTKMAVIANTMSWSANPMCKRDGIRFNVVCPSAVDTPFVHGVTSDTFIGPMDEILRRAASVKMITSSRVAELVMELIEDDTKNGRIISLENDSDEAKDLEYPKFAVNQSIP